MRASIATVATLDAVVAHSVDAVACDLGDETAILHLETGIYYGLDAVSSRVWGVLAQPVTVRELVTTLLGEYEVSRERCEEEVFTLLGQLAEHRLVEIHHAASS
ncbi:MAG: PqqD family protein [Armatimonadetes bacterium]|nr:PqqD family protein [Armatimonadota bacterium]